MAKAGINSHKDLLVWQKAVALAVEVYATTRSFPSAERYGLTPQMRRAAISVVSNISEGAARQSAREFLHFLHVARGSLAELETHMEVARRLGLLPESSDVERHLGEVGRTLTGLVKRIRSSLTSR